MTEPTLETILRRIQGLLANADDAALSPEAADSYRNKADALMFKYQIDTAMADASKPQAQRAVPVWGTVLVGRVDSEFAHAYRTAVHYVATHVGVKLATTYEGANYEAHFCGYEGEVRYAELLMTNVLLAFSRRLEPGVSATRSDDENAYVLRHAGWEGGRIAQALWGTSDKAARSKARNAFRREAVKRGEDPAPLLGNGNSVKLYRKSYAEAFTTELYYRLARMARDRAADERGLILKGRADAIAEAFYERFEAYRPVADNRTLPSSTMHKDCGRCAKAKGGYCRTHSYLRPTTKSMRYSVAGDAAGSAAARTIDLGYRGTEVDRGGDRVALG